MWLLGLDLGQSNDPTALAAVEQTGEAGTASYACRHLERWLGVPYPEQVARVQQLLRTPELAGATLVIDRTGVGRAVFDMFVAAGLRPLGVTVHGGAAVVHDGNEYRVPKRDLVFAAVAVLQQRRLQIAKQLEEAPTLVRELQNYRIKIDPQTAHDSYSAWREGDHDDLVFALSLALWAGETGVSAGGGVWVLDGAPAGWYPSEWAQVAESW
ncbi:MAG TPA: hypothetical protein VII06_43155 [Chloroflexota bacterium]|jgi:hypothetical protein